MKFYTQIAEYYDYIFPFQQGQLDFICNQINNVSSAKILDIGCSTGSLALELAAVSQFVTGIDLDEALLEKAKQKIENRNLQNITFLNQNMLEINTHVTDNSLQAVVCFGNTLVHLENKDTILDMLRIIFKTLTPGGKFLFQIINYDRIIDKNIKTLPTIENEKICFTRKYIYEQNPVYINFNTVLQIKDLSHSIKNSLMLIPLRKNILQQMLLDAGFHDLTFYSNFNGELFHSQSIPLIGVASK